MHSIKVVDESEWKGLKTRWTRKARRQWRAKRGALGPEVPTRQWLGRWNRTSALVEKRCPWIRGVAMASNDLVGRQHLKKGISEERFLEFIEPGVYTYIITWYYMCVCMSPFFPVDSNFEVWYLPCWDKLMEGWPDFRTGERGTMRSAFDRTWHTETLISWSFICIGCNMNTLNQSTKYIEI